VKRVVEMGRPEEAEKAADTIAEDAEGTEVHLLEAVRAAVDLLNGRGVPEEARKLIVVFSDGIDVAGTDRKAFTELGKRAQTAGTAQGAGIVVDALGYAPFEPGKLKNLAELSRLTYGGDRAAKSVQDVGAQFGNVADEIKKQYVVLFRSLIAGDGKEHAIQVLIETGGVATYSNIWNRICENHEIPGGTPFWKKWWFWTFCVGLPLLLVLLLLLVFRKREPVEAPVEEAPAPPPPAAGPQRTVALEIAVSAKGPTIGWIVGINGRYVDQTFKLQPYRTVIGSAGDADIRIEDANVSRRHCEIRYEAQTFRIFDLGSTNGVLLNTRKVPQADLVDGDTLRLGTCEFKFKSIN
jgi:hypothetical protein